jgi:hypothetical protein
MVVGKTIGEKTMRRSIFLATFMFLLFVGDAATSMAQVKRVEMHIAGYLCGN